MAFYTIWLGKFVEHYLKLVWRCGNLNILKTIMDKSDRKYAGFTLPAKGLKLVQIDFT